MEIRIPKLGISMIEGTLVEWLVTDGQAITSGTPLYVLETEKVENEVESPISGTIRLIAEAGQTYETGTVIAEILK